MYRCITELKGLVIDIDGLADMNFDWSDLMKDYKLIFLTSREDIKSLLESKYGIEKIYYIEEFRKLFAPSKKTHEEVLRRLSLDTTEIVYISSDHQFLQNAMAFLNGTIWITQDISYEEISNAPDFMCYSLDRLVELLEKKVYGFFGESMINPRGNKKGMLIPTFIDISGDSVTMIVLGRYFGYSHYMSQLHPYSSSIYLNKKEGKKYFGIFNKDFSRLYSNTIKSLSKKHDVNCVCNVPVRPNKTNRFTPILNEITNENDIEDISSNFLCTKEYPQQKNLSEEERRQNIKGVFQYNGSLNGKNVVIIDDIITTGATMKECIKVIKDAGAANIYIIVLAVNQKSGSYWIFSEPQVICNNCNDSMHLLVNSSKGTFFYSCYKCHSTMSYSSGFNKLIKTVNDEFE